MFTTEKDFHDMRLAQPIKEGVILERTESYVATNVPHLVVHHSPSGYEWGYPGSGPADLALNIVESVLNEIGFSGDREECWKGSCWTVSWILHQKFKTHFLVAMDRNGGFIPYDVIEEWVLNKLKEMDVE